MTPDDARRDPVLIRRTLDWLLPIIAPKDPDSPEQELIADSLLDHVALHPELRLLDLLKAHHVRLQVSMKFVLTKGHFCASRYARLLSLGMIKDDISRAINEEVRDPLFAELLIRRGDLPSWAQLKTLFTSVYSKGTEGNWRKEIAAWFKLLRYYPETLKTLRDLKKKLQSNSTPLSDALNNLTAGL